MAIKISITNYSPTSCKTTTAMNLASSLAIYEKKTLFIDVSKNFYASKLLSKKKKDLSCFLNNKCKLKDIIISTELEFLDFIPLKKRMILRNDNFKNLIDSLNETYEYIIFDTSSYEFAMSKRALWVSDYVIIPIQCKKNALLSLLKTLNAIKDTNNAGNENLELMGLLFTYPRKRQKEIKDFFQKDAIASFEDKIFKTIIPYDSEFKEGFSAISDIKSVCASSYLSLIDEIMNKVKTNE